LKTLKQFGFSLSMSVMMIHAKLFYLLLCLKSHQFCPQHLI